MKITCAGCGMMGSNLVDAFLKAGHEVTVVDLNRAAVEPFLARGAKYTPDLKEALEADFILSNLPNDKIVHAVLQALPKGSLKDKIFVNTTSEVPSDVLKTQEMVEAEGGRYLDATILTYQGEVGPKTGYLIYSGSRSAFLEIESALAALSEPVFLSESTAVAAEIVDLVVIAIHYGYVYTLLEGVARCMQYGISVDDYLAQTKRMLRALAAGTQRHAQELDLAHTMALPTEQVLQRLADAMERAGIQERVCDTMRRTTNRSVADHYDKMMNIYLSHFSY